MTGDMQAFFEVHRGLPREGPGLPEDVHWALAQIKPPARVLDAACGPGADTATLAEALPQARIEAVEMVPHFVTEARERTARFGDRIMVLEADMLSMSGPYDLIWCAGAVYFAGIARALGAWRKALSPGGYVAFSGPVLEPGASKAARRFWDGEGQVSSEAQVLSKVQAAGYRVLETRRIVGAAWEAYYTPMQAHIDALRAANPTDAVAQACDQAEAEMSNWRAARDEVAYLLILARCE